MRASLRAAARGSIRLARTLRPPDLELECGEHTVEGAKGWVWDLRPLARGECAVPLAASSLSSPPLTDLVLSRIAALGAEYPDKEIIGEMLTGFSVGSLMMPSVWRAIRCSRRRTWALSSTLRKLAIR